MSTLRKISFIMFMGVLLLFLFFAALYLTRSEFMPYHGDAVETPWDQVPGGFQKLIMGLIRVSGGGYLAISLALGALLMVPFRKGEKWAALAILVTGLAGGGSSLIATLMIAFTTPASPPWIPALIGCVLLIVGFILTLFDKKKA